MTTIVRGPRPPELEQVLERRRRSGADRLDEVRDWPLLGDGPPLGD